MTDAIDGEEGGYVPCLELPASEGVADDTDAISGEGVGRVPDGTGSASEDFTDDASAVYGGAVGFVAKPCVEEQCGRCGCLTGSSGLVDPGTAVGGSHSVIQSSAGTLQDGFGRIIPWVYPLPSTPGPAGAWYGWGVADTGQQWWEFPDPGSQSPPPPDSRELDGSSVLVTAWHPGGVSSSGGINAAANGGHDFVYYDFGWKLADLGFEATVDVRFHLFGFGINDNCQFSLGVQVATSTPLSTPQASVTYRIRRSTDDTQLFMGRGSGIGPTFTRPPLVPDTWYRIRWQVDGPLCPSRAKIWPVGDAEPSAWDGETTLLAPMPPNADFGIAASTVGGIAGSRPQLLHMTNVSLSPTNLACHGSVCEDSVTQIGPRQYQLKNSYLPSTIVAFVEHAGFPLVKYSRWQTVPNIVEDNPVAGIFSFPASISYSPAYNPGIDTGTVVTACYIVPPDCPDATGCNIDNFSRLVA